METFFQTLASGIMMGSLYSLVGMGVVVIYKSTKVFNFAQGGLVMLGAYIAWSFIEEVGMPIWLALIAAAVAGILIGIIIERFGMRRLVGQPIISLIIITLALQAFINGVVTLFWGDRASNAFPQSFVPALPIEIFGVNLSLQQIVTFAVSMTMMTLFILFFKYIKWGLDLRAVAEDHQAAMCMGISTRMVFVLAWVLSCVLAFTGGVLVGTIHGVNTTLYEIGEKSFPVVLLGGLESIPGVLLAGIIIGILEYMCGQYLDPMVGASTTDIVPFVILLLVLIVKPYGLFGLKRIERI
ncbi:MAG: branched-chain amino acid ABC transporter permease [Desulfatiglans sp.]|jgi:branched-chain amino acid transport system permease protein|nr:branched-chain amino acid ABC transporter permease [Thermodesulfobacteriota bacterium]MEE4352606.1 branched-chain amino acid ABC transporter permease [Desulfatiglans sp.]